MSVYNNALGHDVTVYLHSTANFTKCAANGLANIYHQVLTEHPKMMKSWLARRLCLGDAVRGIVTQACLDRALREFAEPVGWACSSGIVYVWQDRIQLVRQYISGPQLINGPEEYLYEPTSATRIGHLLASVDSPAETLERCNELLIVSYIYRDRRWAAAEWKAYDELYGIDVRYRHAHNGDLRLPPALVTALRDWRYGHDTGS